MHRTVLAALACLLLFPISVQAQQYPLVTTLGIGMRGGFYKSSSADLGSYSFGVMTRGRIGRSLGVEATLDYRGEELFNAGNVAGTDLVAGVSYVPITVSAILFIPLGTTIAPYGVAGVGWYYTIVNYDLGGSNIPALVELFEDEKNREFGYHFGLGIELPLSNHAALHMDYRYIFLGSEIKTVEDIISLDYNTKNSNGGMFTGGLVLYF